VYITLSDGFKSLLCKCEGMGLAEDSVLSIIYLFFFFLQYWGLYSGPFTC
jgi:hypothetical protein